jgi:hypothetical protein
MQTRFNKDKTISREIFQIVAYTDTNDAFEMYNVLDADNIKFPEHEKHQKLKEQFNEKIK